MSAIPASRGAVVVNSPRTARRGPAAWLLGRDLGVAAAAVVVIVASADIRMPIGLPGHRGVGWLAPLVATALVTRHREWVVVVGAASTMLTQVAHLASTDRYLAAAALLYAASAVPVIGRRGWFLALAAAPIHLVALVDSGAAGLGRGHPVASLASGLSEKALFHLAFGLVAGLIGWGLASAVGRAFSMRPGEVARELAEWRECHGIARRPRRTRGNERRSRSHRRPVGGGARRGGTGDLRGDAACG